MNIKEILSLMNEELSACFASLNEGQLDELKGAIRGADRVFVAGAGRSLMMIRPLAMRLMHMGLTAYVVGETVTPAIGKGDLLVIASGSGATGTMEAIARKCKKIGAKLALITIRADSPIGHLADVIVEVKAGTSKDVPGAAPSVQPGANSFEQCVLMIGDAIVIDLFQGMSVEENNKILMSRHANLE